MAVPAAQVCVCAAAGVALLVWGLRCQDHDSTLNPDKHKKRPSRRHAASITTAELKQLRAFLDKVFELRGWQGSTYHFRTAWATVLAEAQTEKGGGWQRQFSGSALTSSRVHALAAKVDEVFFGGQLHSKWLDGSLRRPASGKAEDCRTQPQQQQQQERKQRRGAQQARRRRGRGQQQQEEEEEAGVRQQQPTRQERRPEKQDDSMCQPAIAAAAVAAAAPDSPADSAALSPSRQLLQQQQQQREGQQEHQAPQRQKQPLHGRRRRRNAEQQPQQHKQQQQQQEPPLQSSSKPRSAPCQQSPAPTARLAPLHYDVISDTRPTDRWLAYFDETNVVKLNQKRWGARELSRSDPMNCEGVVCTCRLEALAHTLAHELVHAIVFHLWPDMDAASPAYLADRRHGPIFQLLNKELFGHASDDFHYVALAPKRRGGSQYD